MVNHWIKKKNRNEKLEEARQALQRWCNKISYDDFGFYRTNWNKTVKTMDKSMKAKVKFFEKYPEYKEFDMELKVTWNIHIVSGWAFPSKLDHPNEATGDATGIPEVTIYPEDHWERCAEIAKKATPNYYHHKEGRVWHGDKIAKAITKRTHQLYLKPYRIYDEDADAQQHLRERQTKFWDALYDSGSIVIGFGEDD